MRTTNHEPHDKGLISGAFRDVLGINDIYSAVKQKTIKTVCGKRVPISQAVHGQDVTCLECAAEILREEEELDELYKLLEQERA